MLSEQGFKAAIEEIHIAVEGALAAGEIVAKCDIVESMVFNQLMIFLLDAAEAIDKLRSQAVSTYEAETPKVEILRSRVLKLVSSNGE